MRLSVASYNAIIKKKTNKHGNHRTQYRGRTYDSKKEARYAQVLDTLRRAHNASERVVKVEEQVSYRLEVNGVLVCRYILDFKITFADGRVEYVDVKGYKKGNAYRIFTMKKSLMLACHGIEIREV